MSMAFCFAILGFAIIFHFQDYSNGSDGGCRRKATRATATAGTLKMFITRSSRYDISMGNHFHNLADHFYTVNGTPGMDKIFD